MTSTLNTLHRIIRDGLCHRCGSCAGICPENVIEPGEEYYPSWEGREKDCSDCGLCVRVCPGIGFSFPEHSRRMFGRAVTSGDEHGVFREAFLGYSADRSVRERATSGGIGTQLPRYLLERGVVRGVFSVGQDDSHLWKPKALIARTKEELLRDQLSKYPACSMNHLFREIRDDPGPFLYIGLPCHLHGLRKMAELDAALEKKIALTIGLFCHACLDHQALKDIFEKYGIDEREVSAIEYRGGKLPGYIRALTKKGEWLYLPYPRLGPDYYRPNAKECLTLFFKFHSPTRCRLCIDAMAEYADISIGDPWIKGWEAEGQLRRGYNFMIARTERGLNILRDAQREGAIVLEPFPFEMILRSHQPMVHFKRMRGFCGGERRRKRGLPFPDYGFEKVFTPREKLTESIRAASYFAADRPRLRRALFRALLSRPGRLFVGVLFFRRRVLQAAWEKSRAKCAGRRG